MTGLVVNKQVSVPRYARRRWREIFHQASCEPDKFTNRLEELQGYRAFLKMVRPEDRALDKYAEVIVKVLNKLKESLVQSSRDKGAAGSNGSLWITRFGGF